MANTKPWVAAAFFCENILQQEDTVFSAIRIVDTYIIPPLPEGVSITDEGVRGFILLKGLISLKSDGLVGLGRIDVVMNKTTGEKVKISPDGGWPADLQGGVHGMNLSLQMPIGVKNFGTVWFDVLWNDELLTRIPLMLREGERPDAATSPS